MTVEMRVLAIGCVFGIVQIFVAAQVATRATGLDYALSSRDGPPPASTTQAERLLRASRNYLETFPFAAAAMLVVQVTGVGTMWTAAGALIWLGARALYWVLYALGVPVVRSVAFAVSIVGIGMVLWPAVT